MKSKCWLNFGLLLIVSVLILGAFVMGNKIINLVTHYSDAKPILVVSADEYNAIKKTGNYSISKYGDITSDSSNASSKLASDSVTAGLESSIADMQAITLAVTALAVTFLTIIIAILNFFRERKLELERDQVENIQKGHKELLETAGVLTSIQIVQSMQVDYDDSYFDAIDEYLTRNRPTKQTVLVRIALWNRIAAIAEKNKMQAKQLKCYNMIIKEATKALHSNEWSDIENETLILATLNAYYKHASELKRQNTKAAKAELEEALAFVEKIKSNKDNDTLGYIQHYKGLLYLWSVLGEEPPEDMKKYLDKAIDYLKASIDLSPTNARFYNDLSVAYIRQFEISGDDSFKNLALKTLTYGLTFDPQHGLTYLNRATVEQKALLRHTFGIEGEVFTISEMKRGLVSNINNESYPVIIERIDTACQDLEKAQLYRPKYTNNFYKKAELLLYKILIVQHAQSMGWEKPDYPLKDLQSEIESNFEFSDSINPEVLGCLYIKRNYYDYLNLETELQKINTIIKKKSHHNALEWEKLHKNG